MQYQKQPFKYRPIAECAHGDVMQLETLTGGEFVKRYLRHVLPRGLLAVRYHGFCHPAAKAKRERIAFHTGRPLPIGAATDDYPKTTPRRHLFLLRRADGKTLLSPPRVAFGLWATHSETLMRLTLHSPSFQHTGFLRKLATGNGGLRLAGEIFTVPASSELHQATDSRHPWDLTTSSERQPLCPPHPRRPWWALMLEPKQTENASSEPPSAPDLFNQTAQPESSRPLSLRSSLYCSAVFILR